MMTRYLFMLVIAGHAVVATAAVKSQDAKSSEVTHTVHSGLSFSTAEPKLTLDLFVPLNTSTPIPCVIVVQGGGFKSQDGQRFRPYAEYLAKNGFAAALISYRGRPEHQYQDTVSDAKAAVRYVRANCNDYAIDPNKIGAMGQSAGATLVALLAVSDGVKALDGGKGAGISSRIQAAVAIAGVYDFVARFTDQEQTSIQSNLDGKLNTNTDWIGAAFSATDEHWRRASAIHHVDATDPPLLLIHSKDDPIVPWMQSRNMYEKLREVGVAAEIEIGESGKHGGPENKKELMLAFFRQILIEPSAVINPQP